MNTTTKLPKLDLNNPFFAPGACNEGDRVARVDDARAEQIIDHVNEKDLSTWYVESARRQLAEAFASARDRGVVRPTGYIAHPSQFAGLAFARELIGEKIVRGRIDTNRPLIGCEPRNVIACILLAVAADRCQHLLQSAHDERGYVPVVVLDGTCRVVHVDVEELISIAASPVAVSARWTAQR